MYISLFFNTVTLLHDKPILLIASADHQMIFRQFIYTFLHNNPEKKNILLQIK